MNKLNESKFVLFFSQGWFNISSQVKRFKGFLFKSPFNKFFASSDILSISFGFSFIIWFCKYELFLLFILLFKESQGFLLSLFLKLKGKLPESIIYNVIPLDHISTGKPLYPLSSFDKIISGAIYIGVPHLSYNNSSSELSTLPIPKSQIFTLLLKSIKIFSNLISLWTTFLEWICWIPNIICLNKNFDIFSLNFLLFFTKLNKFPPFIYSIIINIYSSSLNTSKILVIFLWLKRFISSVSYWIFFILCLNFSIGVFLNDLIATTLPVNTFKPKFTLPKAPCPIRRPYK